MAFSSLSAQQRVMVLLELLGGPKFASEMRAAAASTGLLGRTTETTGKQMQVASRRTFLATQALYTLRRYAFYGTLAVGAMGAAVVKLGYSYLSAMQTARVALSPVIKDHAVLEGYLNRLFKISKYSPFVITDLALAFRKMVGGFTGTGVGPTKILTTIQSLTDYLSVFGKVGPGSLNRVTQALIHMANVGRLTGRAVYQLGADGLPIYSILNKELGLTHSQLTNIAKINIPASSVLNAINKYAKSSKLINGAALRISLRTFSGLLQVARDSLSQLSGAFLGGTDKHGGFLGSQHWLARILKPGGPMDKLTTVGQRQGGSAALLFLSKQLSGGTGLAKGLLLLLSIAKNLGSVFIHAVIPAWIMGAHALIIFYPALKLIDLGLGELAKHTLIFKFILAGLAAEFFIAHFRILALWSGLKLVRLATLGSIGPVVKLAKGLKALALGETAIIGVGAVRGWKTWAFALTTVSRVPAWKTISGNMRYVRDFTNKGILAVLSRQIITLGITVRGLAISTWAVVAPYLGWAAAILAVVFAMRRLNDALNSQHKTIKFRGGNWDPVTWLAWPGQKILGNHATGGFTRTNPVMVGERGPELAFLPTGSRIVPSQSVSNTVNSGGQSFGGGSEHWQPIQIIVDRQVLADVVARARQDKQARR